MPGNNIGARKDGKFWAICIAPSYNKTPIGGSTPPIAYVVCQDLNCSIDVCPTVRFNGRPVYTLESKQPKCTGDEPGTACGVKSGTVSGEVKPTSACLTVRACGGKPIVREFDSCTLNNVNCPGVFIIDIPPLPEVKPAEQIASLPKDEPPPKKAKTPPKSTKPKPAPPGSPTSAPPPSAPQPSLQSLWTGVTPYDDPRFSEYWLKRGLDASENFAVGFGKSILNIPSNVVKGLLKVGAWESYVRAEAFDAVGLPGIANVYREGGKAAVALKDKVPVVPMENEAQEAGSTTKDALSAAHLVMDVGKHGVRVTNPLVVVTVLELVGEYAPDPPLEPNKPEVPISTSPEVPTSTSPPSFQKWDDYIKS